MQKDKQTEQNHDRVLSVMERAKANVYRQMGLAGLAIVVTLVLCFAMTVAWYSNIIHTGSMTFQASDWDFQFEGKVSIGGSAEGNVLAAAPGDTGLVEMSITNTSAETLGVKVHTAEELLTEEMQKRIYFYVDTQAVKNGETMERVYISEQEGYDYKILAGNRLVLSQTYCSDAVLMWEWVYDVLGYYVLGTVTTGTENGSPIISIQEYLRPVFYDYDQAVFNGAGYPEIVDGMSVAEYISKLCSTDGYAGTEIGEQKHGYYAVDVDESGYGVWLYLCSEEEIQKANEWDYALGTQEEKQNFQVNLVLTGQKIMEERVVVEDSAHLVEQLALGIDRVQLPTDLELTEGTVLQIGTGTESILDLNGHTLSASGTSTMIQMEEGSSLTIINGTMDWQGTADNDRSRIVYMTGAELALSGVTMTGTYEGIYVDDSVSTGPDSGVYIANSSIQTEDVSIMITGDGNTDTRKTSLVVEKSKVNSKGYIGIMGNGSDNKAGTDIRIVESNISGYWSGIYQPQQGSTMTLSRSEVTGYTGIAVKAGNVKIENCRIFGTGDNQEAEYVASGFKDTGDAIYIEDNYQEPVSVVITGDETVIKSTNRYAVEVYVPDSEHVSVTITGGSFGSGNGLSSDVSKHLPADGSYTCTKLADESYKVGPTSSIIAE